MSHRPSSPYAISWAMRCTRPTLTPLAAAILRTQAEFFLASAVLIARSVFSNVLAPRLHRGQSLLMRRGGYLEVFVNEPEIGKRAPVAATDGRLKLPDASQN